MVFGRIIWRKCGYTFHVDQTLLSEERGREDALEAPGPLTEAKDPRGLNLVVQLSYVVCPFLI